MTVVNNPLFIEEIPGNGNDIRRGSTIKRTIIIKNIGDIKADVDIWIAATDNKSDSLLRWCTFSEKNPLSINAKESKQITFNFQIPQEAIPDIYNYEILVEAASQYPGKIFRRPQQLRILPSNQDAEFGNEPAYSIQPITASANPLPLQAGEKLELKIKVENRSKRVDRYYLNCSELVKQWYTVSYPESSLNLPGLVKETDGLELNPGNAGEITLILHPPQYTPAGNYFPTINLVSSNTEDLVLLDVVYLQILPDDRLSLELLPLERKVPLEAGEFEIEIINHGNIRREISIFVNELEEIFSYQLEPSQVQLAPGELQTVFLKAKPKKWWRRNFWKKDLTFNFDIELENTPTQTGEIPDLAIPKQLPQGTLVWEPRPAWLLWLIFLFCLGLIASIGIFFLLKYLNSQKPSPEVLKVETTLNEYQEYKEKDIPVDLYIKHPEQVSKFAIIRLQSNVEIDRKNVLLESDKFPKQLNKPFKIENGTCKLSNHQDSTGNKQKSNNSLTSGTGLKLPFIQENSTSPSKSPSNINILKCQLKIPNNQKAGTYTFKVEVFPKQNLQQIASTQITDSFIIKPTILPIITELSSTVSAYQEVNTELIKALIAASPIQNISELPTVLKSPPILLNWQISNFDKIKELKIIGFADDGSIGSPQTSYLIKNNSLPNELTKFCALTKNNLICKSIPTNVVQPGNYTFKLTAIPNIGEGTPEITKETAKIKILPKTPTPPPPPIPPTPVNIISFTVNGKSAATTPSFICELSEDKVPNQISVGWQVQEGEDIKVELLPFGNMTKQQDSLLMAVSQRPSTYLLTLKVTNKAGEQKTQGVMIETVEGPLTSLSKLSSCVGNTAKKTPAKVSSPTPTSSPNASPTSKPTETISPTPKPTPKASPTSSPTETISPTPKPTPKASPTSSPTETISPTPTPTPTPSPAVTISPIPTPTPTPSPAVTISPIPTPVEDKLPRIESKIQDDSVQLRR
ncbi:hypothetical protein H6G06_23535 [Anabaena sphaerica FACHB-251]|uniref:Uncharacterized protein n=1 Tax=Anabaena sphaerica FACHB-251 TaxID=2692883 RepID=A0A927A358_9NOST|nr:hypothetical protein [Anabaena sphaerica]MBD2296374.1 hypothetical protein [Anabaena sphaerica FACHB-251]